MLKHLIDFSTLAHNLLLTDLEFFGFWPVRSELIIWAHQWGKTACDSLSYRSEHNEEDTAINPPTHSPPPNTTKEKKKIPENERKREGGGHIINTNTPLNYFKRDFGQFVGLVLRGEKKHKGKQICLRGGKQTSTNDTICHMYSEWRSTVWCRGILSLSESQHAITLLTPRRVLFIFSQEPLTPSHVAVET